MNLAAKIQLQSLKDIHSPIKQIMEGIKTQKRNNSKLEIKSSYSTEKFDSG